MRPYLKHSIVFFFILFLVSCSQEKHTDWSVTFDKNSKEPFGCYIAFHILDDFFPDTKIQTGRNIFSEINKSLDKKYLAESKKRISFVVCRSFNADSLEMDKITRYIKLGNTVCIFSENFSENIFSYFHLSYDRIQNPHSAMFTPHEDTIPNQETTIFFNHKKYSYKYSGLPINYGFKIDTSFHEKYFFMGYSKSIDTPNALIRSEGDGNLIICRNPITMTNHFLLQHNNKDFASYFFSYFSENPNSVTWYSMYERQMKDDDNMDMFNLFKYPPLFYAFLTMLFLMLVYVLFEGKRRQREIPILADKTNSSLEFTETVGRLYYSKSDHKNLSEKMILHYLELVRSKHGLKTNKLDDEFIHLLSQKINQTESDTKSFVAYINYIRDSIDISEIDIKHLYHQLQKFI
jgi:hypothetical protein